MGELSHTIEQRLNDAYKSLRTAHADGDLSLVDARQAEIEDLYRIAAVHGIEPSRGDRPGAADPVADPGPVSAG